MLKDRGDGILRCRRTKGMGFFNSKEPRKGDFEIPNDRGDGILSYRMTEGMGFSNFKEPREWDSLMQ